LRKNHRNARKYQTKNPPETRLGGRGVLQLISKDRGLGPSPTMSWEGRGEVVREKNPAKKGKNEETGCSTQDAIRIPKTMTKQKKKKNLQSNEYGEGKKKSLMESGTPNKWERRPGYFQKKGKKKKGQMKTERK